MKWRKLPSNAFYRCINCRNTNLEFYTSEDWEGHEDTHYRCLDCGKDWWVDGPDY